MNDTNPLTGIPRVDLATLPTPLMPAERLSERLGAEIWIKRDDLTGLAMGGNKVRKLEFLLGDAKEQGCDVVATFGALQSNHARQTAAACAALGLECHLILTRSVPRRDSLYTSNGNLLLDELFGAEIHVCENDDAAISDAVSTVERMVAGNGQTARWIAPGGSEPIGAFGYVAAGLELADQMGQLGINVSEVFHASATGGTQSGLVLGLHLAGNSAAVRGVAVYQSAPDTRSAVSLLMSESAGLLGVESPPESKIDVIDGHMGDGYGIPTDAMRNALSLFATTEGIALDPVYSGKAAGALLAAAEAGELHQATPTVFLHTGGNPGLFAYGRDILI